MITFKFDKKTGRFDFHSVGFLSKRDLTALKAIVEKGYATQEVFEAAFPLPPGQEDHRYQQFHDITWKLKDMGLIIWKRDENVLVYVDTKDYKNNKYEKVTGEFLTPLGKAFMLSMGMKQKSLCE